MRAHVVQLSTPYSHSRPFALSACAVADAESQVPSVPACALSQLPRAQVSLSPLPRPPTRTPKHVSVPSPVHGLPSCAAQRKKA